MYSYWITVARYILIAREIQWALINFYCHSSWIFLIVILAKNSGGNIEKPAQDVFWGGYSGYFSDPDGYLWEVAFGDCWEFDEDGSLIIE